MGRGAVASNAGGKVDLWLFFAFCGALALLGGASRADEITLALLRPFGIGLLAYALWRHPWADFARGKAFAIFLIAMTILAAIQLVPLPASIWSALPGREVVAQIDALLFDSSVARPLTLSPGGTWNALFYTLSLLGGFLVFLVAFRRNEEAVLLALTALLLASVAVAFLEALSGGSSLTFYRITSPNPAGLFSNSNHFGVASALGLLVAAELARRWRNRPGATGRWVLFAFVALFLLSGVMVSGSRVAFLAAGVAIAGVAIVILRESGFLTPRRTTARDSWFVRKTATRKVRLGAVVVLVAMAVIAVVAIGLFQRDLSMGNFEAPSFSEDLRFSVFPVLTEMARQQWLVGAGLGSFDVLYPMFEPDALMSNKYLNEAHNDVLQIVIEGGILGVAIWLALIGWLAVRIVALLRRGEIDNALLMLSALAIVGLGSAFDYVLRTPLMAFIVLCSLTIWSTPKWLERSVQSQDRGKTGREH